jgi:hypothetical protein
MTTLFQPLLRRNALALAGSLALAFGLSSPNPPTVTSSYPWPSASAAGLRTEYVGIDREEFKESYAAQETPMWCWAACAEMCAAHAGVDLKQEDIVRHVKGWVTVSPGNAVDMMRATNLVVKRDNQRTAVISGLAFYGSPPINVIYNQLKQGQPVMMSYHPHTAGPFGTGHVVVVYGLDVHVDRSRVGSEIQPVTWHVADPWCYRQARDNFGNPYMSKDTRLALRRYSDTPGPGVEPTPGRMTGVVLVEATLR